MFKYTFGSKSIIEAAKLIGVTGEHRVALRDSHRLAADRRPGETVLGADQQYPAETVQLQRDSQSSSGVGHHLRAVHTGTAGDTSSCRRDAGVLTKMRHDHPQRSGATLQILPRRQRTT